MPAYKTEPLVTILMATYNGESFISEQLNSILKQSYKNWLLIVLDDGSTDRTRDVLLSYQKRLSGKMVIIDKTYNNGNVCDNFFYLMTQSLSEYVMFCDQDDVWLTNKIQVTHNRIRELEREDPQAPLLVFTDLEVVDENLKLIAQSFMHYSKLDGRRTGLNKLLVQNVVTGCTVMANKLLIQLAAGVHDTENILMHDWWLALISAAFGRIEYLDIATVKYRQHGHNAVGAKNVRGIGYLFKKIFIANDMRESLKRTALQADRFLGIYGDNLSEKDYLLIQRYASMYSKRKLTRLAFMLNNSVFKCGFGRKIAQIIWG